MGGNAWFGFGFLIFSMLIKQFNSTLVAIFLIVDYLILDFCFCLILYNFRHGFIPEFQSFSFTDEQLAMGTGKANGSILFR